MDSQSIEFSLVENALDSIERAVELLAWEGGAGDNSRLKQAILLTAHAAELLLKERLRRIHPSLMWEDVDKYPSIDARTVGIDKAISRLRQIGAIEIPPADATIVRALRNTRNVIEHFRWQTTRSEANQIVAQGLSFAIQFARSQLGTDIGYRFRDDDTWSQLLNQHSAFSRAHGERIQRELLSEGKLVEECSFCNALARNIMTGACSLCGHWERVDDSDDFAPF
jgi:hypothetical protein